MTDAQYVAYRAHSADSYAKEIVESGSMSWEDAVEKAAADFAALVPEGLETPDHHLFTAYDGETEIGLFWLQIRTRATGPEGFILDIEVRPDQRRHGYGRAIMTAGEEECRRRGVTAIGLNVFAQNVGARALYDQLGYQVTSTQMRKRL
jgi:ribosomal protein S18 acetylase RimI-like enzyme